MNDAIPDSSIPAVTLVFSGDLLDFFKDSGGSSYVYHYPLLRRASIKDIVESLGIPHTEIGRLSYNRKELDFSFVPAGSERLLVEPLSPLYPPTRPSTLRPESLNEIRFLVDVNVGKLVRLLRMAGLDATAALENQSIKAIAADGATDGRILLSRNRDLLKLRSVVFGRLIRSQDPTRQFIEVSHLFNLPSLYHPFSRCMACNGVLHPVDKADILDRLEPLTIRYYHRFHQCGSCGRLYWRGSHHDHMVRTFGFTEPEE
ncbi:Mut7-C RNAse domain-containing protein [Desulfofustis glycolicus]|uniref:Twitching motility protein PilT n=1 Tax=Desulfofustis glycolicus DSM 9705 TaxID=1121409 RepID=A0A1M5YC58_9BACT|nr:Mut7-C RNAse domain-containing protein [Desulfofustis glycolicus]MCB2218485.1 Mut7-C ubiquitin/RNAse domain-containing protein [Desulfobulbaceae bacterium]SHI09103.1 hypothetical protein SAMN02745124_03803 [Desulfofustis glycolicus DSM 9705]